MKKQVLPKITFLLLLLTLSFTTKAQLGWSSGISISNVRHNDLLSNVHPIVTGFMGLSYQYRPFKFNNPVSFIAEFLYSAKGYKQTFEKDYLSYFHYFALPVLINFDLTNRFSAHTGVEFSGLIGTSNKENEDLYEQLDLGLNAGIGFMIYKNIQLFARYNYGLLPILNYQKIDEVW